MTRIFPNIEAAMMPDMTRLAVSPPKTALKKTVAMSNLQSAWIRAGFATVLEMAVEFELLTESLIDRHWICRKGSYETTPSFTKCQQTRNQRRERDTYICNVDEHEEEYYN